MSDPDRQETMRRLTNKSNHVGRINRIRRELVLNVENSELTMFFERGSVIA